MSKSIHKAKRPPNTGRANGIAVTVDGRPVPVSPALDAAVRRAQRAAERTLPHEMTTTQAAEFLDVSRPFVVKLVARGQLPCRRVGTHRRIPTDALVRYRSRMFEGATAAADEMARTSQDLGLYQLDAAIKAP